MLIPKNRHEYYLAVIGGNDYPTFPPKTREEQYLAKLAGREVDVPIPKTPKERAYYNIINDIKFEPENRWQTFVAAANDDSITAPVPRTREEIWWSTITLSQEVIVEYTGTLPATLTGTKAGYLESYKIYGNTVQDGTPTPENPIVPSGCGELEITGAHAGQYKLPILSNSAVTNIYLGESQTTRQIRKLVLTGEETFVVANTHIFRIDLAGYLRELGETIAISTHYTCVPNVSSVSGLTSDNVISFLVSSSGNNYMYIRDTAFNSNIDSLKAFLAAQYANGTPVTVWYVLAELETGIVNEPLMKIGDYADTIDSTQTTVQIPTAADTTVIDYDGTLKPDKVELTYKTVERVYISADDKVYQDLNGQLLGG